MAKEFDDYKGKLGDQKYWEDAIEAILKPVLEMGAYRHSNYGVENILRLGQRGCIGEADNKLARVKEFFAIQSCISTLERFSLPVPELLREKIAQDKYTDSIADAINYLIYVLMLNETNSDGTMYWKLPMRPDDPNSVQPDSTP